MKPKNTKKNPKELLQQLNQKKQLGESLRAKPKEINNQTQIKRTTTIDYQPDLCKDYYETGYCGYGDNCRFIHDRSITKTSLQLDKEYDEKLKREASKKAEELYEECKKEQKEEEMKKNMNEEMELKKKCIQCKKEFNDNNTPMTMKCNHWICRNCCIGCKNCIRCGNSTGGVFKAVKKWKDLLNDKSMK